MGIISVLIKSYIVVLFFRKAMTRQELYFNPLGKFVAKLTDGLFEKTLKIAKKNADRLIYVFVLIGVVINGLFLAVFAGGGMLTAMISSFIDMVQFLMLFYIICVILGVFAGNAQMSYYAMYFNRLASNWIKVTRKIFPIKSNMIVVPAIVLIFLFFTGVNTAFMQILQLGFPDAASGGVLAVFLMGLQRSLMSIATLLTLYIWIIIIRSLMSWLSPDPRNPVVQMIQSVTDPVMEPFRRMIPPLGPIDVSPMVLILFLYFLRILLFRIIGILG